MFVELIELLRCPRRHEETQLVASATRSEARHIVDGVLGCPVCNAEFPITNGVVHIDAPEGATPIQEPSADVAMRLAAFLELTDARGFALLCGRWGAHADLIHRLSETQLVLINPPANVAPDVSAGVVLVRDTIPFAHGSARGVALVETTSRELARSAVRAVRPGGRVIGPVALDLPEGVREIARDDRMWVAERTAAPNGPPQLVSLRKASR